MKFLQYYKKKSNKYEMSLLITFISFCISLIWLLFCLLIDNNTLDLCLMSVLFCKWHFVNKL